MESTTIFFLKTYLPLRVLSVLYSHLQGDGQKSEVASWKTGSRSYAFQKVTGAHCTQFGGSHQLPTYIPT